MTVVELVNDEGETTDLSTKERDITDHKQIEEGLINREKFLDSIIEQSPFPIWISDLNGTVRRSNPALLKQLNITKDEFIDKWNVFEDSQIKEQGLLELHRRAFEGEIVKFEIEWSAEEAGVGKSRKKVIADASLFPLFDASGKMTNVVALWVDITERKLVVRALRESKDRLKLALDVTNSGIWDFNPYTFTDMHYNDTWFKMLGYEPDELPHTAETWMKLLHPEDLAQTKQKLQDHIEGRSEYSSDFRMRTKSNDYRWIHSVGKIISWDNDGHPQRMIGIHTDINKRKRYEDDKIKLQKQIQQSQKMEAIGTLAGGIAHDFNNMLGVILGNAELAMDDVSEWNPARHNLEEIKAAGLRSKDVVKQLLNFSKKTNPQRKPVSISPIIKDSLKFLRSSIPENIEIRRTIPDESGIISADPTQIHQVMMNLCKNAAQAMSENGGIMGVCLSVIDIGKDEVIQNIKLNPGQYVKISVSDTGHGVAKEHLDRIFEPYFNPKKVGRGSGIGLSVVHGIVKNHNGVISVDSENGKGTTFNVIFPAVEEDPVIEETATTIRTGNERILFVDDEKSIADMASQMLERLGYTVTAKTSSTEMLETFRNNPDNFDLIISDMCMPNLAGDKLAKEIVQIRPNIPIILCTGYSEKIDDKKAKSIGFKALVLKPIVKSVFAKTIRKVLDTKQIEQRRHKRFKVRKGAMAIPASDLSKQGTIIDISKAGLAFCYDESKGLNKEFTELTISMAEKAFNLEKIPCRTISNLILSDEKGSGSGVMRRCSIQFGELDPNHTDQLDCFIENHTIAG